MQHPYYVALPPFIAILFMWVGLASVGNDTVKHAAHYLSYSRQPGTVFVFGGGVRSQLEIELEIICAGRMTLRPYKGNYRITWSLW